MRFEQRQLNAVAIKNSDTTGATKYQDLSLTAGVEVEVGEFQIPIDAIGATWGNQKMFAVLFDDTTTAVREEGVWRFYVEGKDGQRKKVYEARSEYVGASGQVSVPSEWNFMPQGGVFGSRRLFVTFESDASDITDSTDHTIVALPIVIAYP